MAGKFVRASRTTSHTKAFVHFVWLVVLGNAEPPMVWFVAAPFFASFPRDGLKTFSAGSQRIVREESLIAPKIFSRIARCASFKLS